MENHARLTGWRKCFSHTNASNFWRPCNRNCSFWDIKFSGYLINMLFQLAFWKRSFRVYRKSITWSFAYTGQYCSLRRPTWTANSSGQYKIWTADCGLRTADYGLRTGYKIWTRYKTRTRKYGLGIKHGQGIKRGLRTGYKILTTDYFGKNRANWF